MPDAELPPGLRFSTWNSVSRTADTTPAPQGAERSDSILELMTEMMPKLQETEPRKMSPAPHHPSPRAEVLRQENPSLPQEPQRSVCVKKGLH